MLSIYSLEGNSMLFYSCSHERKSYLGEIIQVSLSPFLTSHISIREVDIYLLRQKKQSFSQGVAYPKKMLIFFLAMHKCPINNREVYHCPILPVIDDKLIRSGMCMCVGSWEGRLMEVLSIFKSIWPQITSLFYK